MHCSLAAASRNVRVDSGWLLTYVDIDTDTIGFLSLDWDLVVVPGALSLVRTGRQRAVIELVVLASG